jgi:ribosome-associated protein
LKNPSTIVQCSTLGEGEPRTTPHLHTTTSASQGQTNTNPPNWLTAARAADSKKAKDILVLNVREVTFFTDYFLICTAGSQRQAQAIAEEIGRQLKETGEVATSVEGYGTGDWVLLDYGDLVIHVFSESARAYYDLERLWRGAQVVDWADEK